MDTIFWTQFLISVAVFIQCLEYLHLESAWADGGIWQWQILQRDFDALPSFLKYIVSLTLPAARFKILLYARLIAAFLMPFFPHWILMLVMLLTSVLILLRWRGAFNGGSDFMTLIVLLMMTIANIFPHSPKILVGCLWYIALQTTLSYFVSGTTKLKRASWRSGKSLSIFLHTTIYEDSPLLDRIAANKVFCRLLTWMVLAYEVSFPVLFIKPQLAWIYLPLGFLFHLSNVYIFGLNRFLTTWISTYPAVYFCAQSLHRN